MNTPTPKWMAESVGHELLEARPLHGDPRSVNTVDLVMAERALQDRQWGGEEHDDSHDVWDWLSFIEKQVAQAKVELLAGTPCNNLHTGPGRRLIKIAALGLAACESVGREHGVMPLPEATP